VKISGGHYVSGHQGDCWCTFKERTGREPAFTCGVCHYFLQDGALQYCGDSTHGLAGKTVPLPELPPEHRDTPS
jgi:hypothetical protein